MRITERTVSNLLVNVWVGQVVGQEYDPCRREEDGEGGESDDQEDELRQAGDAQQQAQRAGETRQQSRGADAHAAWQCS